MISAFLVSLLAASVSAHGVIIKVQGTEGSPDGIGFQVDESIARNCTTISPCQLDTTIIRDAEINANIVNQCGRTELAGNIDVGENTENQLAAGTVTQVTSGSTVAVTIHQVNADGAGPYVCDLDVTSNSGIISQNLTVTNNVPGANGLSQAKTEDFVINVAMPDDLACTGGSTGNICTVRCRNNAVAGPFGGCFPVQQTDVTPAENSANQIQTLQSLDVVNKQIEQNIKDLPVAVEANQNAGADSAVQNKAAVDALLGLTITSSASPVQTPEAALGGSNNNNNNNNNGGDAGATTTGAAGSAATEAAASSTTEEAAAETTAATGNNNNNNNSNRNGRNGRNRNNNNRRSLRRTRRSQPARR